MAECISTKVKQVYFHDVVTLYAWLYPNEVKINQGNIDVSCVDDYVKTTFLPNKEGNLCLVTDFSVEKFFKNYIETVNIILII